MRKVGVWGGVGKGNNKTEEAKEKTNMQRGRGKSFLMKDLRPFALLLRIDARLDGGDIILLRISLDQRERMIRRGVLTYIRFSETL